ncbi:MAG: histidine kinase [Geobacter sp.]|nr:MAG: histidine kinase [Geobacter sp.]
MTRFRFSIKRKLTVATLLPLSIAIVSCWLTGIIVMNSRITSQARQKVHNDLNSARVIYNNELGHIRDVVKFTASAPYTAGALARSDLAALSTLLSPLRNGEGLDILTVVDASGTVLFRSRNPQMRGDDRSRDPLVVRALKGEVLTGTVVIPPADMVVEGEDLARQAAIRVLPTPHARPAETDVERSGMVLMAAAPIRDSAGNVLGALYGGILLNNNNTLVDRIKSTVYEGDTFKGQDVGSATIFLRDLRIATNVPASGGGRAIGTRMSEEVYNRVILGGEKWFGRAFVVNEWVFSAYEPILSLEGVPIGALYTGMLEKPSTATKLNMSLIFSGVLLLGTLLGLAVSGFIASRLARPIRELETMARRVTAGERDLQLAVTSHDEVGDLAAEFNEMTRALAQREEEIGTLNRDLEQKVLERTAQLEEKNRLLVRTQEELVRAAKLADIGILASGVAHEINNPLAIIRGNTELLQMAIPGEDPSREEVDTIAQQVVRVERIVGGLLQFARQEQKRLGKVDLNQVIEDILRQIGHQVPLERVTVSRELATGLPELQGDGDQLRQVFTNLILNAIQAMAEGGTLTVATAPDDDGRVRVEVRDTGRGIPPADREKIFNPFFTTRPEGTGLGLSVSYGIVKEHHGTIEVASQAGSGTTFRVLLPVSQESPPRSGKN